MKNWTRTSLHNLIFWVVAVLSSMQFALAWVGNVDRNFVMSFIQGNADFPYRCRLLSRWILSMLYKCAPLFHFRASWMNSYDICNALFAMFFMLATVVMTRKFLTHVLIRNREYVLFLSFLPIYMANYNFLLVSENKTQFPWDPLGVFLFGFSLFAVYVRNRYLYYPILILAAFNKESSLFLPAIFFLMNLEESQDHLISQLRAAKLWLYLEVVFQFSLWRGVNWYCVWSTGPATSTLTIRNNIHLLSNPFHYSTYLSVFGFLLIPYILCFRKIGDPRLCRIAWLAPLWLIVTLLRADVLEIRTNSEWIVYLSVCIALIISNSSKEVGCDGSGSVEMAPANPLVGNHRNNGREMLNRT